MVVAGCYPCFFHRGCETSLHRIGSSRPGLRRLVAQEPLGLSVQTPLLSRGATPFLTRARLRRILAPKLGERVLEVGPGTGYYTLDIAEQLAPAGVLDILDLQQEMLDHTMRKTSERQITNIVPTQGDAQELPYPDDTFDAAYMTVTLGEVVEQDAALRELRRVL